MFALFFWFSNHFVSSNNGCCYFSFSFCLVRFNIREIFEIYSHEREPKKINELLLMGKRNLLNLQKLAKMDKATWLLMAENQYGV